MIAKHAIASLACCCLSLPIGAQQVDRGPMAPARDTLGKLRDAEAMPLFIQGKQAAPERYRFAVEKKALFLPTPDGRSFYILWYPAGYGPANPPPMIVTLHGHGSWAFDEFFLWQPHAEKRGYGIAALQWWFGKGETPRDYYLPHEIYPIFESILRRQNSRPHTAMAHGFSRGSANIYGVTAMDHATQNNFFLLTVANAGKAGADFPINVEIEKGVFGPRPFEGTHWVTCAGAKDPHPDRDGIAGMRQAAAWVARYGGVIELSIEDPKGDHGCLHRNPDNIRAVLDVFERLLAREKIHKGQ